jgi:hypothetical protein
VSRSGRIATVVLVLIVAAGVGFGVHHLLKHHNVLRADAEGVVWLCRPGDSYDPCTGTIKVSSIAANGASVESRFNDTESTKFDCFYVYPTVSTQTTANANLAVQDSEIGSAFSQAAPFSQLCRVYAPMYRQRTAESLVDGLGSDPIANQVAYDSLLIGWNDYLDNYNDGRPIIFIGDSQGSAMLITLLRNHVDNFPSLRSRVVSAILLGGNVEVPTGRLVGGSFQHIPLCQTSGETGCVIAYSSFPSQPPSDSNFGIPGQGVSLQSGQTTATGLSVGCVNPVNLSGAQSNLSPWFLNSGDSSFVKNLSTSWMTYPDLYTAQCKRVGNASWLQVNVLANSGGNRPVVSEDLGPEWGYHSYDLNLAFGNLLQDVRTEEGAFTRG